LEKNSWSGDELLIMLRSVSSNVMTRNAAIFQYQRSDDADAAEKLAQRPEYQN